MNSKSPRSELTSWKASRFALENIDAVIALIKKSKDTETARKGLMKTFKLSAIQATEILKMQLQRLTGLEVKKIEDEYKELIKLIEKLRGILKSRAKRMLIVKNELIEINKTYGDQRRTEIHAREADEINLEDTIAEEDMVVTISHEGYIKRFPVSGYRRQSRGGTGSSGGSMREDDYIEHLFVASTHHYILFFSNLGKCYWLKVHEIPQLGKAARGKHMKNLLRLSGTEMVNAHIAVREFDEKQSIVMFTKLGIVKKTNLADFSNPRKGGIIAISIDKGDDLVEARLTDGSQDVVIGTTKGMAIRFKESEVREMGRSARGVAGIRLGDKDSVIGALVVKRTNATILVVSSNGYGKRSDISDYRLTRRGGKGVITMKSTAKTGVLVCIREVVDKDDIMIITENGMVIRSKVADLRTMGRNTQGIRLVRLKADDQISDVTSIREDDTEE